MEEKFDFNRAQSAVDMLDMKTERMEALFSEVAEAFNSMRSAWDCNTADQMIGRAKRVTAAARGDVPQVTQKWSLYVAGSAKNYGYVVQSSQKTAAELRMDFS